jgi:hypothetical protein
MRKAIIVACAFLSLCAPAYGAKWGNSKRIASERAETWGTEASDVECTATCTIVGNAWLESFFGPPKIYPVGFSWSTLTGLKEQSAEHWPPEEASLAGLTCVETSCIAVGNNFKQALIRLFSGTLWGNNHSTYPAGAKSSELNDVSCAGKFTCETVGHYVNSSGAQLALIELWNGTEVTIQSTPSISGATNVNLSGVWCTAGTTCEAVGSYKNSAGNYVSLAERYNGKEWSTQETPNPTEGTITRLQDVSCISISQCYAVGYSSHGTNTATSLAETWNGTKWTIQTTPNPAGAKEVKLHGVACPSTACWAVGGYLNSAGKEVALAEGWNGKEWALQEVEQPSSKPQSYGFSAVSCPSGGACVAVGIERPEGAVPWGLFEYYS